MRNYACTTQVPNRLFDELLPRLSFAELKVLLVVNRATWGWVADKSGRRIEWAWLSCSRMQQRTGLSRRAITNATAALVRRRLLVVADAAGNALYKPDERRGQVRLYYSLGFSGDIPRRRQTSALRAEVDQHGMPIIETNPLENQGTMSPEGRTTNGRSSYHGPIGGLLRHALPTELWERLHPNENRPAADRS